LEPDLKIQQHQMEFVARRDRRASQRIPRLIGLLGWQEPENLCR
jgi:hypothetical protein